jgi:hypothetical protein
MNSILICTFLTVFMHTKEIFGGWLLNMIKKINFFIETNDIEYLLLPD